MKNLTGFYLPLLLIVIPQVVVAQNKAGAVVKLVVKGQISPTEGSGVLIQEKNHLYLLTSSHVLLDDRNVSDRKPITIELSNESLRQKNYSVDLILNDWGSGLALARLSDGARLEMAKFAKKISEVDTTVVTEEDRSLTSIELEGFPFGVRQVFKDRSSKVIGVSNRFRLFPDTPNLLEITDAHGEYGMSGGAVWNTSNGKLAALITHRAQTQDGNSIVLGIPGGQISKWIQKVLTPGYQARFQELKPGTIVGPGFTLEHPFPSLRILNGQDPAGIGGPDQNHGITVTFAASHLSMSNNRPDTQSLWMTELKRLLTFHRELKVSYLARWTGRLEVVSIQSAADLIQKVENEGYFVVFESPDDSATEASNSAHFRLTLERAKQALDGLSGNGDALANELSVLLSTLNTTPQLIRPEWIQVILEDTRWDTWFIHQFEKTTSLMKELNRLATELQSGRR